MLSKSTVAVYTLGCKVNQNESEAIVSLFKQSGYREVPFEETADVYIINTCTVTHMADRKSRQMVRRAVKNNPNAVVVVTGCYAQTAPGEVSGIPGVNIVIGTKDRFRLVELVEEVRGGKGMINAVTDISQTSRFEEIAGEDLEPHRVRAYLKVQEGCRQYCSYCIIPYARGPLRSRPLKSVLQAAQRLVDRGFKEIVLTGIHTGAYGAETGGQVNLALLVEKMVEIPGLARLRISSIDPHEVNDGLLDLMARSRVLCRHLHIPLQSGDDFVLRRMNRVYDTAQYAQLVKRIRERIPGIAVTTDVMVGFPGETDRCFQNTLGFVKKINFSALHVFKYSPRRGTPAADFPDQVPWELKEARSKELISLGRRLSERFAENYIGQVVEVLAEQQCAVNGKLFWEGHTDNYLNVAFFSNGDWKGRLIGVRLEKVRQGIVFGKLTGTVK